MNQTHKLELFSNGLDADLHQQKLLPYFPHQFLRGKLTNSIPSLHLLIQVPAASPPNVPLGLSF